MNGPPGPGIRQCCPPWGRDGAANCWGYPSPRRPPAGIGPPGGRDVRMDWGLLPTRSVARCAAGCPGRARKSAPAAHRRDFRRVVAPRWSSLCVCADNHRRADSPGAPAKAAAASTSLPLFSVNYFCRFRQLFLPVHPLFLVPFLSHSGSIAGDVEFQDDRVVDHPVDGRRSGHWVGEDVLPLGEDQVGRDAQGPALVAFGDEREEHLGLLCPLGQVPQAVQQQEVVVVEPLKHGRNVT